MPLKKTDSDDIPDDLENSLNTTYNQNGYNDNNLVKDTVSAYLANLLEIPVK